MVVYNTIEEVKKFLVTLKIFDKICISYQEIVKKRKGMVGFLNCLKIFKNYRCIVYVFIVEL